jgi:hypothetical protein
MALTDMKIKAARPESRPYHLTDGHGLFLVVQPNGSKLWRWKYRFRGKFRLMAFGSYPETKLTNARAAHVEARSKLLSGTDPMAVRKAEKYAALESEPMAGPDANCETLNCFREIAAQWFKKWKAGKVERYARDTETRIKEDVLSRIGDRPIAAIRPSEIANTIVAIEQRGAADVARRALQNTQQIFDMRWHSDSPSRTQPLRSVLLTFSNSEQQRTSLAWKLERNPRANCRLGFDPNWRRANGWMRLYCEFCHWQSRTADGSDGPIARLLSIIQYGTWEQAPSPSP